MTFSTNRTVMMMTISERMQWLSKLSMARRIEEDRQMQARAAQRREETLRLINEMRDRVNARRGVLPYPQAEDNL